MRQTTQARTYANTVQLYPCRTSSIIGTTTALYSSICVDSGPNTLSNEKSLVLSELSLRTWSWRFFVKHSTTDGDAAFFSAEFLGLQSTIPEEKQTHSE